MPLILQQKVIGRETIQTVDGEPISVRRTAAILLDEESGDTHVVPWDPRTEQPILSVDLLRQLNPDVAADSHRALRKSPRRRVRR